MTIEDRLKKAIENRGFSDLEFNGFKINPNLALLIGAAIGYKLALDNKKKYDEFEQKLKIATEALGVYANEKNWDQDGIPDYYFTAQKALKQYFDSLIDDEESSK